MHDAIYQAAPERGHPALTRETLIHFARQAGVPDLAKFKTTMTNTTLKKKVFADAGEAEKIGVTATTTLVVNGHLIMGAQRAQVFDEAIDNALQKTGK